MLKITCLGTPQLYLDETALSERLGGKPLALFCYLAVTGRQHSRDALANLLWSELTNEQARNNLRYTLSDLRQLVGDYLIITPQTISFNRHRAYWLDVERLQTIWANQAATVNIAALQAAFDLYHDEFLAGFHVRNAPIFDAWVARQREELHTLALQGLYSLAQRYQQQGEYNTGMAATHRLLHWEPWHEPGHRLQMQLLAATGQRAAALAQYVLCSNILCSELGVEPEPATSALYEEIRDGKFPDKETGRQGDKGTGGQGDEQTGWANCSLAPPLLVSPSPPHNLPGQLTPFIGRETEIDQLCKLLATPDRRLITLTGLGGIGKTRLALAVGQRILDFRFEILDLESITPLNNPNPKPGAPFEPQNPKSKIQNPKFSDGVWFVPLIGVAGGEDTAERLAVAILDALQLPRSTPVAPTEQLLDLLQNCSLLLILDNFEHLPEGAEFLRTLLQRTTAVKLLVTSRRILNLQEEFVWPLDGLAVPEAEAEVAMTPDEVQRYDGIALFVECALRADRTFQLTPKNQADVLQICHSVNGLPLGIELAAAMTRYTGCRQLRQTIQQGYRALVSTQRDLAPRHRTLTAVFEHSWRLLTATQARVLAACTLFPQPFTTEAAIAVTGATSEILFALVDQSLLKETAIGRFELHELVRQYAADQFNLDPQRVAQYRQRHADYYSSLVEADAGDLFRSPAKLQLVQRELSNLRMVWQWAIEEQQLLPMMRMGDGLFIHFLARGPIQEGWDLCNAALQMLRHLLILSTDATALRFLALVLACQAFYANFLGRLDEVIQLAQEAIAIAQQLPDERALSLAYGVWGMTAFIHGELEEHQRLCLTGLAYARTGQLPYMVVVNLAYLSAGLALQEKLNEAFAALDEALQIVHQEHLVVLESYVLSQLSFLYGLIGDWALADGTTQQALQVSQGLNSTFTRGHQYLRLAFSAEALGDYPRVITWTDKALEYSALVPEPFNQLGVFLVRGRAMHYLGELDGATAALQQLLTLAQTLKRQTECIQAHIELGYVGLARQTWHVAETHYRSALEIAANVNLLTPVAAQAGLAQLALQRKDVGVALAWAESCLERLLTQPWATHYDAATAALTCYQVLQALEDARAVTILQQACAWVEQQSLKISDEALRRSFLENVPTHRQLLTLL